MPARHYYVVLNPRAGTALGAGVTEDKLRTRFAEAGLQATVADGESLDARIQSAVNSDSDVIVAAGGDGTVTAVASALVGTKKILCVLPLGTVNRVARDLNIPLDLNEAFAALAGMEPKRIDVGEVNGRFFLHMVVIGLVPGLAAGREQIRGKKGPSAMLGLFRYFFRRLKRTRRLALIVEPQSKDARVERVKAIAVANNAYDEGLGRFFSRRELDRGYLTLYLLRRSSILDFLRLAVKMVLGRWREDAALDIKYAKAANIRSSKAKLQVMLDGEVQSLDGTLHFRIRPRALSVLAPVARELSTPVYEQSLAR